MECVDAFMDRGGENGAASAFARAACTSCAAMVVADAGYGNGAVDQRIGVEDKVPRAQLNGAAGETKGGRGATVVGVLAAMAARC